MGYYIQTNSTHGKAEAIAEKFGGEIREVAPSFGEVTARGKAIIVVMDNGPFEAAGFAYDWQEYEAFTNPDDMRPKKYVIIDREDAERESGFKR